MAYERRSFAGATPTNTTISGSLATGATSFTLSSATGWPTTTAGGFVATIDAGTATEEQVLVGARSGTACSSVTRGYNGTTDQDHASGASITHTSGSVDYNEANYTVAETVGKVTTKGDLLVADGANSFDRVGVGANATIPIADSAETTGVKWVAVSGDVTISTSGAVSIGSGKITAAMISDAELAAIGGLTSAADKVPYFTGSGTADVATFTSAGRALVDDADASAQRTTLGLGSIATQASSSVSITGGSVSGITDLAVADGGTGASTAAAARVNLGVGHFITFSRSGTLVTGTGTMRWRAPVALTLKHTRLACNTAPTGAAILVDVNKNGTTVYSTQGNRPTIAISGNAESATTAPDVTAVTAGDYLTVDIDQVGSTVAGADLTITIYAVEA